MLKKLGLLIALFTFCGIVRADNFEPDRVYQVGVSSITLFKISVSTSAATKVDSPVMPERVAIEIQNIDSTANLWCVPGVSISSAPVNGSRKIAPGNTWVVSMLDKMYGVSPYADSTGKYSVDIYCTSDGTSATSAIVTQIH